MGSCWSQGPRGTFLKASRPLLVHASLPQDEYCTPRVEEVLDTVGWAGCSARADAGTTPRHEELERLIAEFLVGGRPYWFFSQPASGRR